MGAAAEKKPSLAVLIGGMGKAKADPAPPDEAEDAASDDIDSAHEDAATALIDAVGAKDSRGVVEAMEALYDLCAAKKES